MSAPLSITVLQRAQLLAAVQSVFPNAEVRADFDLLFAIPRHDDVANTFAAQARKLIATLRGTRAGWSIVYDCDKFARTCADIASLKHSRAQGFTAETPEGMAFGTLAYFRAGKPGAGHAVNVLITERGVETWEPQTGEFVTLTDAEKHSAWLALF